MNICVLTKEAAGQLQGEGRLAAVLAGLRDPLTRLKIEPIEEFRVSVDGERKDGTGVVFMQADSSDY